MKQSGYDPTKTDKLVAGFTTGFDLGYRGPTNRKNLSQNLPFRIGSPFEMWEKIMKEVKLGRYGGPYKTIPFDRYVQSPIGLVPKAGNKTRLIFHLSYDFPDYRSINFYTPPELCKVKYKDLDHAIGTCLKMKHLFHEDPEKFEGVVFAKTDVVSAFRILPGKPQQHFLFILKATHPITKEVLYFVDKCLPFGSSISCALFQSFSDALTHVMEYQTGFISDHHQLSR